MSDSGEHERFEQARASNFIAFDRLQETLMKSKVLQSLFCSDTPLCHFHRQTHEFRTGWPATFR